MQKQAKMNPFVGNFFFIKRLHTIMVK